MILDGDILNYFESIHKDVKYLQGDISSFEFVLDYLTLQMDAAFQLNHSNDMLTFIVKVDSVLMNDDIYPLLNEFNFKSNLLKAYYDKTNYQIIVKSSLYVKEDDYLNIMNSYFKMVQGDEYDILEDFYKFKGTLKEENKDNSLDDLMGLLDNHRK